MAKLPVILFFFIKSYAPKNIFKIYQTVNLPFLATNMLANISGTLLPNARKVNPIIDSGIDQV